MSTLPPGTISCVVPDQPTIVPPSMRIFIMSPERNTRGRRNRAASRFLFCHGADRMRNLAAEIRDGRAQRLHRGLFGGSLDRLFYETRFAGKHLLGRGLDDRPARRQLRFVRRRRLEAENLDIDLMRDVPPVGPRVAEDAVAF